MVQNWLDLTTGDCSLSCAGSNTVISRRYSREEIIADLLQKNVHYVIERPGLIRLPLVNVFMTAKGALLLFCGSVLNRVILSVSEDWDSSSEAVRRAEEELVACALPVNRQYKWGSVALHADHLSGGVTYTIAYNSH